MPKIVKMGLRPQLDVEAMTVDMQVMDGKKLVDSTTFHWADLPEAIQQQLKLAGMSTVLQQRCSSIKADPVGKLAAMSEVFEIWEDGEYERKREGGARVVAPIIEVLANLKGASLAQVQASWSKQGDEFKAAVLKKYADEIEAVIAQRNEQDEVELDDLL